MKTRLLPVAESRSTRIYSGYGVDFLAYTFFTFPNDIGMNMFCSSCLMCEGVCVCVYGCLILSYS